MLKYVRFPKPAYLLSQFSPAEKPDAAHHQLIAQVADSYQLGELQSCYRAPRSNSLNFIVTSSQGKFVFRRHNLSEEAVAYEHQVLDHLQQRGFPAPRMHLNRERKPWVTLGGANFSVYEFVAGYCPTDFLWWPATRREIIVQCGRVLGEYHRAVADLVPTFSKWNAYRPTKQKRWCEGEWFRQAVAEIRACLQKSTADHEIDDFCRSHLDAIAAMLDLESVVEGRPELARLVIHGDYAPWNVLFRPNRPPFVLDFNESRLDLKVYDVTLATYWFAWRNGRLDQDRALALQTGYGETNQLAEIDIDLAGAVFRWVMARSMIERLYHHYTGKRRLTKGPAMLAEQYQMCVFAEQQPQQLVAGLRTRIRLGI